MPFPVPREKMLLVQSGEAVITHYCQLRVMKLRKRNEAYICKIRDEASGTKEAKSKVNRR